ncbi:MAG: GntR family transcriptional regulator [Ruminiclostridium sp.]|nr:GntR family transcriptional regulator [Ruminiclostridium sp.]
MFSLRLQGGLPLSEQLEARIAELIISGEMAENEKLPAVREVAKELTINPNTVQKTYRQLEQRGLIYSLPGKGSYVAERSQYSSAVLKRATEEFSRAVGDAAKSGLTKEIMTAVIDAVINKEGEI